uniref:ATP synthase F0 subunit 8 n=1 Tax=Mileewa mira TaxID=700733 RepID=A0A977TM14_9HEMI|nr:ATP synthase F0 subunit 8 [Mileewa mira]UXX17530.1 ATP synthase F0 subunit 8 [Mileewa mira]
MPQMSPMWWMLLMILTISMMFFINSILYFNLTKIKFFEKMISSPKNIWKW